MEHEDGSRILKIEPGVVRLQTLFGAERAPAFIGLACLAIMFFSALSGKWKALYGIPFWVLWHGYAVLMYRRDPQYWAIMWDKEWKYRWPSYLAPAPGVVAKPVPIEPSVPVRGEAGVYGE